MPFFVKHVVQVDVDQQELRILSRSTEPSQDWGKPLELVSARAHCPLVQIRLGKSIEETCLIDSGFTDTLSLRSKIFSQLLLANEITESTTTATMVASGAKEHEKGRLVNITLAGHKHQNLSVMSSKGKRSRGGLDLLRRYIVTFDLHHNKIYLKKSSRYDLPEEHISIGLGCLRKEEKTIIEMISSYSPASRAGFCIKDEIISVSGEKIAGKPMAEIRWMFREAVKKEGAVSVEIRRFDKTQILKVIADGQDPPVAIGENADAKPVQFEAEEKQ